MQYRTAMKELRAACAERSTSDIIRAILRRHELTQRDLAAMMGCSVVHMNRLAQGHVTATPTMLGRILAAAEWLEQREVLA